MLSMTPRPLMRRATRPREASADSWRSTKSKLRPYQMHNPSLSQNRTRSRCFFGTFNPASDLLTPVAAEMPVDIQPGRSWCIVGSRAADQRSRHAWRLGEIELPSNACRRRSGLTSFPRQRPRRDARAGQFLAPVLSSSLPDRAQDHPYCR
jgi:hypothetical protein